MYYNVPDDRCRYKVLTDTTINIKMYRMHSCYVLYRRIAGLSSNYIYSDYYRDLTNNTINNFDLFIPAGSIFYLAPILKKMYIRFYRKDNKVKELVTSGQIIVEKDQFAKIDCEPYNA